MLHTGLYVVVSHETLSLRTVPYLGVGFALRCFQRLSLPNIATRQFTWWQSRYTRGPFSPVLSSRIHSTPLSIVSLSNDIPLSLGAQTISSPISLSRLGCRGITYTHLSIAINKLSNVHKSLRIYGEVVTGIKSKINLNSVSLFLCLLL